MFAARAHCCWRAGYARRQNAVINFAAGDTIDLLGQTFATGASAIDDGGEPTVVSNGTTLSVRPAACAGGFYRRAGRGHGHRGGRRSRRGHAHRDAGGSVPVERLRAGDAVCNGNGVARIAWCGSRRIDRRAEREETWPFLILRGAFGAGAPAAITRRHRPCGADGGALIPVRYLVKGRSTARVDAASITIACRTAAPRRAHAEGSPCERYLDTGNRRAFENGAAAGRAMRRFVGEPSPG